MNAQLLKIILSISFFFFFSKDLMAQEQLNFPAVNEKTYSYYLKGEWKKLIETGKIAKKAGIDFYFLKLRMGIAYYSLKRYRQSIPYFEAAAKESPDDEFVLEYLYYAYLFADKHSEARNLSSGFPTKFKEKLRLKEKAGLSAIEFETKFDTWDDYTVEGLDTDTIQQAVQQGFNYYGLNAIINFRKGSVLTSSYSWTKIKEEGMWLNSSGNTTYYDRNVSQNQIYLSFQQRLGKGWDLTVANNLLFYALKDEYNEVVNSSTLKSGPGSGSGQGSGSGSGFGGGSTSVSTSGSGYGSGTGSGSGFGSGISAFSVYNSILDNSFDYVFYFGLYKDFSLFKTGITASLAGLDNNLQLQPGLNFTVYPFGNADFYLTSRFSWLYEKFYTSEYSQLVFKQNLGIKLWKVYLEPSYTFGEMFNLIEWNGYIINNSNDIQRNRFELLTYSFLFKGRLNLFFKYQTFERINYYIINDLTQSINYQYQTFTGGITWKF
ncbi:MAG: hypothetical protein U0W24_08120 [Bacteroidales bacterium]